MTKVYLSARYSGRIELVDHADLLTVLGWEVTSRWLGADYDVSVSEEAQWIDAEFEERTRIAMRDIEGVRAADILILFTEEPNAKSNRVGHWVEFGMAIGLGKRVIVIGPAQNAFCCLPQVERYKRWTDFLNAEFPLRRGPAL